MLSARRQPGRRCKNKKIVYEFQEKLIEMMEDDELSDQCREEYEWILSDLPSPGEVSGDESYEPPNWMDSNLQCGDEDTDDSMLLFKRYAWTETEDEYKDSISEEDSNYSYNNNTEMKINSIFFSGDNSSVNPNNNNNSTTNKNCNYNHNDQREIDMSLTARNNNNHNYNNRGGISMTLTGRHHWRGGIAPPLPRSNNNNHSHNNRDVDSMSLTERNNNNYNHNNRSDVECNDNNHNHSINQNGASMPRVGLHDSVDSNIKINGIITSKGIIVTINPMLTCWVWEKQLLIWCNGKLIGAVVNSIAHRKHANLGETILPRKKSRPIPGLLYIKVYFIQ